jgi:ATP-dependent Lhr-like helicase
VVTIGGEPVLYAEKNGRNLVPLGEPGEERLRGALEALAEEVRKGRLKQLAVERFDGEAVVGSAMEPVLIDLGFRQGPRKLTLSA